jgi:hypothetical protein
MYFQCRYWLNPIQKCSHNQMACTLYVESMQSLHVNVHKKHVKIFARAGLLRTVYGPNVYRVYFNIFAPSFNNFCF